MTSASQSKNGALDALEAIPAGERSRAFREPWEAQAFAITLALHRRGVFTWDEWAATLSEEIRAAQGRGDPDSGETYYHHWLRAIERLVKEKGIATGDVLHRYQHAWHHAAERTPHGMPLVLTPDDFH